MDSVFWDAHGVIFIEYLEKGRTMHNAPSNTSNIAQTKEHELGFESLSYPPYPSDLAPSDYHLFLNLKKWLCRRRFELNEEVEWETERYFVGFDKSYYLEDIEKLKDRWTHCCYVRIIKLNKNKNIKSNYTPA